MTRHYHIGESTLPHVIVHPIAEALRQRRLRRGLGIAEMSRIVGINRNTIESHENTKYPSLAALDRWARALDFELALIDLEPARMVDGRECEIWSPHRHS